MRADSCESGHAFCWDGEVGAGSNQYFFKAADVVDRAQRLTDGRFLRAESWELRAAVSAEVEDGVADELPGAVEGDVAAAVAFEDLDSAQSQLVGRQQDVGRLRVASQGDDRRVLEQEQHVADASGFAEFDQFLLDAQSGSVVDAAELEDGDHLSPL